MGLTPRWRTLGDLLCERAAAQPDRRAYIFLRDGETQESVLTYGALHAQASAVAATLRASGVTAGDRVVLPLPAGPEAIVGFFGCIYAGAIAVFVPPVLSARRVAAAARVLRDAEPAALLGSGSAFGRARALLDAHGVHPALRWIDLDRVDLRGGAGWRPAGAAGSDVAYLQYASGATTTPRGVMITHANVLANVAVIEAVAPQNPDSLSVQWLPLFHDMGLVTALYNLHVGFPCVMFAATQFSHRPMRWIEAISRYRATSAGGPDAAFAACAELAAPRNLEGLDLSAWELAFCGAEPVRPETMRRFAEVFEPYGFRAGALFPCYGLAEATLTVSGGHLGRPPATRRVSAESLRRGQLVFDPDERTHAVEITSCGPPVPGHDVRIVDPAAARELPAGTVGEIWVHGPSVSPGYWNAPAGGDAAFGARLAGSNAGPFLRTGDHGFFAGGELHVTGRIKDLIVVDGANHYPQDIEATVRQAHPQLPRGRGAAFAPGDASNDLVVLQEIDQRAASRGDAAGVIAAIRQAVADAHGLAAAAVVLVRPETIPVTSSGKVQRYRCREAFHAGTLKVVAEWRRTARGATAAPAAERVTRAALQAWLLDHVARHTNLDPTEIDARKPLADYGLESADAVALALRLEQLLGYPLTATVVYSYPSIGELADHLAGAPAIPTAVTAAAAATTAAPLVALPERDVAALLEEELGT